MQGATFLWTRASCVLNIIDRTSYLVPGLSTRVTGDRWKARAAEAGGQCQDVKKSPTSTQHGDTSVVERGQVCQPVLSVWGDSKYFKRSGQVF